MLEGETFVARMIRTLRDGGCDEVFTVVAAPHDAAVTLAATQSHAVLNATPELGMLSSLQAGLRAASAIECDAAVIALVDHPRVQPTTVRLLIDAWRASSAVRVRPLHAGRVGHPFVIARDAFERVLCADPSRTTRDVLTTLGDALDVTVDDAGVLEDLDTADAIFAANAMPPRH